MNERWLDRLEGDRQKRERGRECESERAWGTIGLRVRLPMGYQSKFHSFAFFEHLLQFCQTPKRAIKRLLRLRLTINDLRLTIMNDDYFEIPCN